MRPHISFAIFYCFFQEVVVRFSTGQGVAHNLTELLLLTNNYRSAVASSHQPRHISNMNRLVWSERLAAQAEETVTCRSHRPVRRELLEMLFSSVNVGRRRDRPSAFSSILRDWYNQRMLYDTEEGSCIPWDHCRRYMNMINAKHREMGCAYRQGCGRRNDSLVLLCLYEGGNEDMYDFQYGDVCTACSQPTPFCENSLCVACNASRYECECTKTCGRENVGQGHLDASTCTCTCQYGLGPNCDQECRNPENIFGVSVCEGLTANQCQDPAVSEFCPAQCVCNPMPTVLSQLT